MFQNANRQILRCYVIVAKKCKATRNEKSLVKGLKTINYSNRSNIDNFEIIRNETCISHMSLRALDLQRKNLSQIAQFSSTSSLPSKSNTESRENSNLEKNEDECRKHQQHQRVWKAESVENFLNANQDDPSWYVYDYWTKSMYEPEKDGVMSPKLREALDKIEKQVRFIFFF